MKAFTIFQISFLLFLVLPLKAEVKNLFDGKTMIKKPFDLRDPFLPPKFKGKKKTKIESKKAEGVFDNRIKIGGAGKYSVDDIVIVGVIIGKERRVSVRLSEKPDVYVLKEGDKLGQNRAEIKAILPGGIILVEKVSNIYGEDEYIETVIPISR